MNVYHVVIELSNVAKVEYDLVLLILWSLLCRITLGFRCLGNSLAEHTPHDKGYERYEDHKEDYNRHGYRRGATTRLNALWLLRD